MNSSERIKVTYQVLKKLMGHGQALRVIVEIQRGMETQERWRSAKTNLDYMNVIYPILLKMMEDETALRAAIKIKRNLEDIAAAMKETNETTTAGNSGAPVHQSKTLQKRRMIKLQFRAGSGARRAYKVFTNTRVPGKSHPKQIHICYVPDRDELSELDQKKIQTALEKQWMKHFGDRRVRVEADWEDALEKWGSRKTPKQWRVDRSNAKAQIKLWMADVDAPTMIVYGRLKKPDREFDDLRQERSFAEAFTSLHTQIHKQIPSADKASIAEWWEEEEAPRLLETFARYVQRNELSFGPWSYIAYLSFNIGARYAVTQFLRAHPEELKKLQGQVSDEVESQPGDVRFLSIPYGDVAPNMFHVTKGLK